MSCIIGYIKNDEIFVGCDTRAIEFNSLSIISRKDKKIFIKDDFIFGYAGSVRVGQILKYLVNIPKVPAGISDYEYLCGLFVPSLITTLKENESIEYRNGSGSIEIEGQILIVYNFKLFTIESDFQVTSEEDNYCCIGSGGDYSKASLYALETLEESNIFIDSLSKIQIALKASEKYSASVGSPFFIYKVCKSGVFEYTF